MKYAGRYGHSINCRGAKNIVDEVSEAIKIEGELKDLFRIVGDSYVRCNSSKNTISGELSDGTTQINKSNPECSFSVHFNGGKGTGVECWVHNKTSQSNIDRASRICNKISGLGFTNRGVKKDIKNEYYELKNTNKPHIIIEVCFTDTQKDIDVLRKVGHKKIATAIVEGLTNKDIKEENGNIYRVQVGAFKEKANAEKLKKELESKGYSTIIT